ncbi:MAG: hypothetical protein R3B95_21580 [Nitrospirales bacterium]|nr:hypothetical protein [Nitrospirales bacterium]
MAQPLKKPIFDLVETIDLWAPPHDLGDDLEDGTEEEGDDEDLDEDAFEAMTKGRWG